MHHRHYSGQAWSHFPIPLSQHGFVIAYFNVCMIFKLLVIREVSPSMQFLILKMGPYDLFNHHLINETYFFLLNPLSIFARTELGLDNRHNNNSRGTVAFKSMKVTLYGTILFASLAKGGGTLTESHLVRGNGLLSSIIIRSCCPNISTE